MGGGIEAIRKYKWLNTVYIAVYILSCILIIQYTLHLPLSYLTKQWFWTVPESVKNIEAVSVYLPKDASVVSQNNITPHLTHRSEIFTLWPEEKKFLKDSPCGNPTCSWFRWNGKPQYLIVDTSKDWDARHFLTSRDKFIEGLQNLEKVGILKKYKQIHSAVLYKIQKY